MVLRATRTLGRHRVRHIVVSGALVIALPRVARAQSCMTATCAAASTTEADVLAALPASGNPNATVTVMIPAGTSAWASPLSFTVPPAVTHLTIHGATTVSCSGTPGSSSYTCSATDNTMIQDHDAAGAPPLMAITTGSSNSYFRVTGLSIQATTGYSQYNGMLNFSGSTKNFRMDHCHEVLLQSGLAGIQVNGQIEGVFDHDVLDLGDASTFSNGIRVYNDLLDTVGNGDGAFQSPSDWGSRHFVFLEASQITGGYANDCDEAGRMVERYNMFINPQDTMQSHPTKDYGGPFRGCRAAEFYRNYINGTSTFAVVGGQGGTWLVWGNTVANSSAAWFWAGATYRSCSGCNGAPAGSFPPNGWGQCGTDMNYPGTPGSASPWDGNSDTTTGYPCLDNLGRGQQLDAMNGADFPDRVNTVTKTQSWPHQYLEPVYLFMNTLPAGLKGEALNQDYTTSANRDIYFDCGFLNPSCSSKFTGAAGTGYGTLADRPSACTPGPGGKYGQSPTGSYGVAYFATDANAGRGELYVCTAKNTWTAVYEPYVYPHPLVSGVSTGGTGGAGGAGGTGGDGGITTGGSAGTNSSGGASGAAGSGANGSGGNNGSDAGSHTASPTSSSSGCSCRVPQRKPSAPLGELLSLIGLGVLVERRRASSQRSCRD